MDRTTARQSGARSPDLPPDSPHLSEKTNVIVQDQGLPDLPFLVLTTLLVIIGLIMLFSASYPSAYSSEDCNYNGAYYFIRQLFFAIGGLGLMWVVSLVNYEWLRPFSFWILVGSVVLLVLVLVMGSAGGGATRWLKLGPLPRFQPSEIAKAAIVIYFAAMSVSYGKRMQEFRVGFLLLMGILLFVSFLVAKEPHLSGAVIIFGTGVAMMFLGGTRVKHFVVVFGPIVLLLGLIYLIAPEKLTGLLMKYAQDRITAWQNPEAYSDDEGYQIVQSLYAIGSGGLMGLGLGKSRQKYLYLPEPQNDYIFAIVCEELGFIGALLVLLLFAMLIIRGYWIALHAKSKYGALLAAGFTTLLALQVFLNIGVVTNFLPSTGISLPFFSYGGTALLLNLAEMGVILGVSRQKKPKLEKSI